MRDRENGTQRNRGTEEIREQNINPSAAVAAPPFNKGGKVKVPLAKGGRPAGPGGFSGRSGKDYFFKKPFASFASFAVRFINSDTFTKGDSK